MITPFTIAAALVFGAFVLSPFLYYLQRRSIRVISPVSVLGLSLFVYGTIGSFGAIWDPEGLVVGAQGAEYLPLALGIFLLGFMAFAFCYWWMGPPSRTLDAVPGWKIGWLPVKVVILAGVCWLARVYTARFGLVFTKLQSRSSDPIHSD